MSKVIADPQHVTPAGLLPYSAAKGCWLKVK